jgi:hypothetical protein
MRIRSTKPEFWRSERIASVSWDARLVLKGLESYVDDNGVGKDDLALIVGDVFMRDMLANPRDTLARVSEAISSLNQAGLIHRYTVDGTNLLYVSFWEDIQRIDKPGKGRFPRPDGTFEYKASSIRESVASPPVTLAPGTGEQGNRGTGEQGISKTSKSQSSKKRANVSTDSEEISEMTLRLSGQRGIQLPGIQSAIAQRCGIDLTADQAWQVSLHLLEKAPDTVKVPQRYVLGCIDQSTAEVEQWLYEQGIAS